MRDRQVRAHNLNLVRQEDTLTNDKHEADNAKLIFTMHRTPKFESGDWVWISDDKSTITGGGKHVLKDKEVESNQKQFALVTKHYYSNVLDGAVQEDTSINSRTRENRCRSRG